MSRGCHRVCLSDVLAAPRCDDVEGERPPWARTWSHSNSNNNSRSRRRIARAGVSSLARAKSSGFFLGGGGVFARGAPPWNKMRRFDRLNFHASVFFFFSFPTASSPIDARAPSGRGSWFLWPTQLLVALVSSGANKLGSKMCKNSSISILPLFLFIFTFESRYFCHVLLSSFLLHCCIYKHSCSRFPFFFYYSSTPKEPDIAQDLIYNSA